jgi:hypothetical protein
MIGFTLMHIYPLLFGFGLLGSYALIAWFLPAGVYLVKRWRSRSAVDGVMLTLALIVALVMAVPNGFFARLRLPESPTRHATSRPSQALRRAATIGDRQSSVPPYERTSEAE